MSDRLSALLQRFELRARVVHGGALCGAANFDEGTGVGHLHLLWRGPLRVANRSGQRSTLREPSVLFFPPGSARRLDGGPGEGADLVCASVDFGAGDENPFLRGLPVGRWINHPPHPGDDQVKWNSHDLSAPGTRRVASRDITHQALRAWPTPMAVPWAGV
jgi:Cupin